jgi:hypothetical protein
MNFPALFYPQKSALILIIPRSIVFDFPALFQLVQLRFSKFFYFVAYPDEFCQVHCPRLTPCGDMDFAGLASKQAWSASILYISFAQKAVSLFLEPTSD